MSQRDKLLFKILMGNADANIPFAQLCQLLRTLGFDEHIRGSHQFFPKMGSKKFSTSSRNREKPKPIR